MKDKLITVRFILCGMGILFSLAACGPRAIGSGSPPTETMEMPPPSPVTNSAFSAAVTPSASLNGPKVVIDNFSFGPQVITVTVGSTVTWVNQDDTAHTVSSTDKLFSSGALDTGDTFTYRFSTPGTFKYYCMIHPKMTATVIVQ